MPVIRSAKKKMRADIRRRIVNLRIRRQYKQAVKEARDNPTANALSKAYSRLDTAAKKKVIHKNKAFRLKSRLAKNKVK